MKLITINGVRGYIDESGTAQLNTEDISRGLGFVQQKNGSSYVRWERVNGHLADMGFPQLVGKEFIPENVFYRLAMRGESDSAVAFQNIVADEILPSIRKTGSYSTQRQVPQNFGESLRLAAELYETNQTLMLENTELKVKTAYVDLILKSKGTLTITQIAKDYGMAGQQLNKILHEDGIQYKQNKQWLLYRKYQDEGYTKSETIDITHSNGDPDVKLNTRWTQKGRLFIHELLTKRNILPYMERQSA